MGPRDPPGAALVLPDGYRPIHQTGCGWECWQWARHEADGGITISLPYATARAMLVGAWIRATSPHACPGSPQ